MRIQSVLPGIIHENLSGFYNRICILQHIINSSNDKLSSYLLFIDFEKAVDALEWNFMLKCLKIFNFDPDLIK